MSKTINYKEKYEKALKAITELLNKGDREGLTIVAYRKEFEEIFPELKDEGEIIREEIIEHITLCTTSIPDRDKFIDWLEKQGEKNLINFDEAEQEKADFVGDGFIECHADYLDFKEGNTYWLEYIGDDKYNVRSDNLLGKTYHITPCQLYTIFKKLTWLEKQDKQKHLEKDLEMVNPSDKAEQKPAWSEEDEEILQWIITDIKRLINDNKKSNVIANKELDWLITIKQNMKKNRL